MLAEHAHETVKTAIGSCGPREVSLRVSIDREPPLGTIASASNRMHEHHRNTYV